MKKQALITVRPIRFLYSVLLMVLGGLLYGLGGIALVALAFCDIELKEKESENPI